MAVAPRAVVDPILYPEAPAIEPVSPAVAWSAIWAGTATAIALSLVLLTIGSGFGFAAASPWPGYGPPATSFSIAAGIWLIVMQWLSSAVGGYIAGRMRTRWHSLHTHEVFFRDTAHGLIVWSVATVIVAAIAVVMTTLTAPAATGSVDLELGRNAADAARRAAATLALFNGIAMLVGAFIASTSAAVGGRLRDLHP